MSIKENDEFSSLTSELKKAFGEESELLSKRYDWFNDMLSTNKSAAKQIGHQDVQKIGELTPAEAKDIESRTKESGLSDLVTGHVRVQEQIINGKKKLSKLWPKIIKNLTTQ